MHRYKNKNMKGNTKMSNVDQVVAVLPAMPSRFTLDHLMNRLEGLTRSQVSKAVRSIDFVEILGNGEYQVKGRKTIK